MRRRNMTPAAFPPRSAASSLEYVVELLWAEQRHGSARLRCLDHIGMWSGSCDDIYDGAKDIELSGSHLCIRGYDVLNILFPGLLYELHWQFMIPLKVIDKHATQIV